MASINGSAASERASRRRPWTLVLGATLVVAFAASALAQDGGILARYPDAAKVAADYADDAERYMALKILYDDVGEKTRGARVPGAYAKSSAYFDAFQVVAGKYMSLGKDAPANVAYSERLNRLFNDAAFKRTVIEKYRLADIPAATPAPAPTSAAPVSGDPTDEEIQAAMLRGAPFVLAALAGMVFACRALLRNSVGSPSARTEPLPPPPGMPAMPDALRVVRLPGVEYPVETSCGVVIDKETTIKTTVQTTTTSGSAYQVGNQIHFTPGQTQTTASSVQDDLIWVRTAEGREESWAFRGGTFKARQGQVLTLITRPLGDGSSDRLFAYNHATGQLERCDGIARANAASGKAAWWASWAIGSVGFGIACGILIGLGPNPLSGPFSWFAAWVEGAIGAAILAFVVEAIVHRGVARRRNAVFEERYVPGFREFLEQSTPALGRRFAGT